MKIIYILLFLLLARSTIAQQHEAGFSGSWFRTCPEPRNNLAWFWGGEAGVYYKYTPIKWFSLQTGIHYKHILQEPDKRGLDKRGSIVMPLRAVFFSSSRYNLIGGVYMEHLTDDLRYIKTQDPSTGYKTYGKIAKKPAWGYEAGIKRNMKYCNLMLTYRQCFSSWMKDYLEVQWNYNPTLYAAPKSRSVHLSVEIPIWRNHHAKK